MGKKLFSQRQGWKKTETDSLDGSPVLTLQPCQLLPQELRIGRAGLLAGAQVRGSGAGSFPDPGRVLVRRQIEGLSFPGNRK